MSETSTTDSSRRRLLAGGLGGAVVLGGLAGAGSAAATSSGSGWRRETLTLDVACLGQTWRDSPVRNPADAADFRLPFLVEGNIYPSGTVSDGFVPTSDRVIGRWLCHGWLVLDGSRPEPHASTRQTYVFGDITPERLFPPDTLVSQGLEGTFNDSQVAARAVGGGTGMYVGALGQVRQTNNGVNTTVLDDGTGDAAPNFIFEFDLLLPDV